MFAELSLLESLDLSNNLIGNIHEAAFEVDGYWVFGDRCKVLKLSNNSIPNFKWFNDYNKLEYVDLRYNKIETITFWTMREDYAKYSIIGAGNITFDLRYNNKTKFKVEANKDEDYLINHKILLDHNPLMCSDDDIYETVKSWKAKEFELDFGDQKCNGPEYMEGVFIRNLELDHIFRELPCKDCKCLLRSVDMTLIVSCAQNGSEQIPGFYDDYNLLKVEHFRLMLSDTHLKSLPNIAQAKRKVSTEIFAANNDINKIHLLNIHDGVEVLDLRNNKLKEIESSLLGFLGAVPNVSLSGNPWTCDCSTIDFLNHINTYKNTIIDYASITCVDGRFFKDLESSDICFDNFYIIAIIGVILGLLGVVFGLFYKFNKDIKIWLYANNWCMWFVSENDLDEDKVFDAFVVFASPDQPKIEDLVEGLESGRNQYKCCVGIRDWEPGKLFSQLVIFIFGLKYFNL